MDLTILKFCKDCSKSKPLFEWTWKGHGWWKCKDCYNAWQRSYNKRTRETRKEKIAINQRRGSLKFLFGITVEEYDKMLELQLKGCAICKQPCKTGKRLAVDHNHITNEIRGLLCSRCNVVIGTLEENENLIWNILDYLKRTTWNKKVA